MTWLTSPVATVLASVVICSKVTLPALSLAGTPTVVETFSAVVTGVVTVVGVSVVVGVVSSSGVVGVGVHA